MEQPASERPQWTERSPSCMDGEKSSVGLCLLPYKRDVRLPQLTTWNSFSSEKKRVCDCPDELGVRHAPCWVLLPLGRRFKALAEDKVADKKCHSFQEHKGHVRKTQENCRENEKVKRLAWWSQKGLIYDKIMKVFLMR